MPQDGHWLASFEVIPPPKVSFPAAKKIKKSHAENFCSWSKFLFENFGVFCLCGENFVTPFSTLAMIKGSLPTKSTTPDRLRCRARPPDDVFTVFWGGKALKKGFFRARHRILIYTPKEAHSRIFVTGGSVIAWQMLAKKKAVLGQASLLIRIQWRLYTWWQNQVNSDGPIWVEMCVCRKQGGVQWLVSCDLSNVMHRDSAVEGGAIKHEKGDSWEIYISEPMGELWFGEEICWT